MRYINPRFIIIIIAEANYDGPVRISNVYAVSVGVMRPLS